MFNYIKCSRHCTRRNLFTFCSCNT